MPKANPLTRAITKTNKATASAPKITLVEDAPKKPKSPSREGRVLVGGHFAPEVQMLLKVIAAEKRTTVQALLSEAINMLLSKYGKPEVADITTS